MPSAPEVEEQPLDLPPIRFTERVKDAGARMLAPVAGVAHRVRSALQRNGDESAPEEEATLIVERAQQGSAEGDAACDDARLDEDAGFRARRSLRVLLLAAGVAAIAGAVGAAGTWWLMREAHLAAEGTGSRIGAALARKAAAGKDGTAEKSAPDTAPAATEPGTAPPPPLDPPRDNVVETSTAPRVDVPQVGAAPAGTRTAPTGGNCELKPGTVAETLKACIEEFNRASR